MQALYDYNIKFHKILLFNYYNCYTIVYISYFDAFKVIFDAFTLKYINSFNQFTNKKVT